eukprot:scaffold82_cov135-Skeletonema_menzelii.AAC.2
MKGQGVDRAQLKPPTLQPRADGRKVRGRIQNGDNSVDLSYPNDMLGGDIFLNDSTFGKFDMALEDAKRTLEKEKMFNIDDEEEDRIDKTESKGTDDVALMERSNPDPDVFYALIDETKKTGRSKKKTKTDKEDLLVEAIKRALVANTISDDSYSQFSHDESSFYGDELVHMASGSVSSNSFTSDTEASTLDETLLSGYSAVDSHEPLKERKHSQSKDEETADDAFTLEEETLISDYTEDTPMTSSISCFQSPFMCLTPKKQQDRTQRNHQIETGQSASTDPTFLEDKCDYHDDDDLSCDNTFTSRGTVGLMQDILSCGTYRFCCGNGEKYRPKEDIPIIIEETRSRKDSRVTSSTQPITQVNPLTVKERMNITILKKNLAEEAAEAKKRELVFEEEEDANAVAETLNNIFWKGDGVFSDESSSSSEKSDKENDLLDLGPQVKPESKEKTLLVTAEASIASSTTKKPYLLSAARSFGKSISFRRQKSSDVQKLPVEIDIDEGRTIGNFPSIDPKVAELANREAETNTLLEGPQVKVKSNEKTSLATSEASITSSTKRKPYLMSAVKSFGKSRRKKSSDVQQLPVEIDVERDQEITTLPEDPHVKPKSNEKASLVTSEASTASSTKKKPYLLSAVKSFGKSISFRRQKSSSTAQLPLEIDIDDDQEIENFPSIDPKVAELANREAETNVDTVQAAEKDLQRGRSTSAQPTSQGYEIPRKKSFRQMGRSRSRSRKRSLKKTPVAEIPPSPTRTKDRNAKESLKLAAMVDCPTSPARTVDLSFSNDSSSTDPELSEITATKWKSAIDKVTGKTYYYNNLTKEVTWEAPVGFVELKRPSPLWKAAYDTTTGRTYYYNRQTKAVTWSKPKNIVEA